MLGLRRRLLFPRHLLRPDPQAGRDVAGLQRLAVDVPEGEVEAWLLPGRGVDPSRPGPLVVFAHGNGELIEHWPALLQPYRELGVSVLLPEYRGYGRSRGTPSEGAIVDDVHRFVALVARRPDVDPQKILYHGRSIGTGVVCSLARRRRPSALLLSSPFTSIPDVLRRFGIPGALAPDVFDNLSVVRELDVPTLIVHGRRDRLIPFAHAERLHAAAPHSTLVAFDAAHADCPPAGSTFWGHVADLLARIA